MLTDSQTTLDLLELTLLEILWTNSGSHSVKQLRELLPQGRLAAYTTVFSALDRLINKGYVKREKAGHSFVYWARATQEQWIGERAAHALTRILRPTPSSTLLSFLDLAERLDPGVIDRLSELIEQQRGAVTFAPTVALRMS